MAGRPRHSAIVIIMIISLSQVSLSLRVSLQDSESKLAVPALTVAFRRRVQFKLVGGSLAGSSMTRHWHGDRAVTAVSVPPVVD